MKKNLNEILDILTPEELGSLPEEVFQTEPLDAVTLKRIQTAVEKNTGLTLGTTTGVTCSDNNTTETGGATPAHKKVRRTHTSPKNAPKAFRRVLAAAACIALLLSAGAGVYAYAAAKRDYKNALTFFYENNLSTEGLTKNEIKEVYRDFYSHSFTNDLTTAVLLNSRPDVVRGFEITGNDSEWDTTVPETSLSDYKTPVYYEYENLYTPIEGTYNPQTRAYKENFDKSVFTKYRNGEKVWEVFFTDFSINGYYGDPESEAEPVLVYGTDPYTANADDGIATLIALDTDGTVLWRVAQNNVTGYDRIDTILPHPDGSYTTFGRCFKDNSFSLTVNKYDKNGIQIFANVIDIKDHIIRNATLTGSGYLVHLTSYVTIEFSRILHLDSEGNLLGDFRYESEENDFFISDLCEHNGTVYISGYVTPKAQEGYDNYLMRNIYTLMDKVHDAWYWGDGCTHDELLTLFREQFTAVLLVCGQSGDTLQEFYSVAGSLGDEVYVAGDSVCWFTKGIIDCSYSPQKTKMVGNVSHVTSQETFAALCRFYANTFNPDGTFKEQKKLELMTELRWPK